MVRRPMDGQREEKRENGDKKREAVNGKRNMIYQLDDYLKRAETVKMTNCGKESERSKRRLQRSEEEKRNTEEGSGQSTTTALLQWIFSSRRQILGQQTIDNVQRPAIRSM